MELFLGPLSSKLNLDTGLIGTFFHDRSYCPSLSYFSHRRHSGNGCIRTVCRKYFDIDYAGYHFSYCPVTGRGWNVLVIFYRELQFLFYDEDQAKWLGVPTDTLKSVLLFLTGLSIGLIMKIVGALMIDAIILLPAMAALRIGRSFGQLIVWMSVFGLLTTYGGLLLSLQFDFPTGASITLQESYTDAM
ncbi:metal ABC transporter permease [Paenibacillus sp. IHBB 10380]|uniref:metal ABC transporter permease n=1 Tax=Paenibacillus sp. IHBB 10380 TaxID=1566358 RepID=UPI0005CFADD3|nr:iron chelate uptake ABC transporter family permease subunit [Paenibacillus sp. IHBB 10380]AJS58527.1 hypothetical protein UB51_08520 [Paenibacillus sp. IHBB 10380]